MNIKRYLVSSLFIGALILTSFNVFAQKDKSQVAIYPYEDKDLSVITVLHGEEKRMTLSIENLDGDILYYSEKTGEARDYSNFFDFTYVEDGQYNLVVKTDDEQIEQKFQVSDGLASMEIKKNVIEPFFKEDNAEMILSYLNFDHVAMNIKIFDKKDQLIFTKELGKDEEFSQVFNIAQLRPGEYNVLFIAGEDEYWFTLDK